MPICRPQWDKGVSDWCNRQALACAVVTAKEMKKRGLRTLERAHAYRFGFLESGQVYFTAEPMP